MAILVAVFPVVPACNNFAGTLRGPITQSKWKSASKRGHVVIVKDRFVPSGMASFLKLFASA